ncbi:MAG: isoprenylcysteine carboxylmethyltransferase family protein [Candidatus Eremiobacteraeota bacterium]|nr:isoprenylcysteine carboxylmethyltransferase family protein [Candidatus Eremiobacteraeota bacterium]
MASESGRAWREPIFKNRGALLALPAVALALRGRPSGPSIAVGVPLALAGEALRGWAVGYSGVTTRGDTVTALQLVTAGPYAYVRNPLYVGNFLTALGFTIAFTGRLPAAERTALAVLGLGTMLGVYAAIVPLEEAYLRETFGEAFETYVASVPRIVPRATAARPQAGSYDASVIVRAESRTFVTFGAMLLALGLKAVAASDP